MRSLIVAVVVALMFSATASAKYQWREDPAYVLTIPAHDFRTIPKRVCPFGISDFDVRWRGIRLRDSSIGYVPRNRDVFNYRTRTVRVYVFCG